MQVTEPQRISSAQTRESRGQQHMYTPVSNTLTKNHFLVISFSVLKDLLNLNTSVIQLWKLCVNIWIQFKKILTLSGSSLSPVTLFQLITNRSFVLAAESLIKPLIFYKTDFLLFLQVCCEDFWLWPFTGTLVWTIISWKSIPHTNGIPITYGLLPKLLYVTMTPSELLIFNEVFFCINSLRVLSLPVLTSYISACCSSSLLIRFTLK